MGSGSGSSSGSGGVSFFGALIVSYLAFALSSSGGSDGSSSPPHPCRENMTVKIRLIGMYLKLFTSKSFGLIGFSFRHVWLFLEFSLGIKPVNDGKIFYR